MQLSPYAKPENILTILEVSPQKAQSWDGCEAPDHLLKSWQSKGIRVCVSCDLNVHKHRHSFAEKSLIFNPHR